MKSIQDAINWANNLSVSHPHLVPSEVFQILLEAKQHAPKEPAKELTKAIDKWVAGCRPLTPDERRSVNRAFEDCFKEEPAKPGDWMRETLAEMRKWLEEQMACERNPDPNAVASRRYRTLHDCCAMLYQFEAAHAPAQPKREVSARENCHKLDTETQVFFYEQDFYVLSNFSSFELNWKDTRFPTSEHAYHWEKFSCAAPIQFQIRTASSAHAAFKIAEENKSLRRKDWDSVKVEIMRQILTAKADQHEYVKRKLLATGERELIEDSWRDDFWGWGPNRDGKNMLGRLWMEIRTEIRAFEAERARADTGGAS